MVAADVKEADVRIRSLHPPPYVGDYGFLPQLASGFLWFMLGVGWLAPGLVDCHQPSCPYE